MSMSEKIAWCSVSLKRRHASRGQGQIGVTVRRGLLCLGVSVAVSGCEVIYFPECDTDCDAAAGSDSYATSRGY